MEVGHTRIKGAHLPAQIKSIEDLKKVEIHSTLSAPWLKQNLQNLFKREYGSPLDHLIETQSKQIALSIFGPLYDNRMHGCAEMYGVPQNIKEVLQNETGYEFRIEGDSVSWAIGAIQYLALKSEQVAFPCLAITLGTHSGIALIESPNKVTSLDFCGHYYSFQKLEKTTEVKPPIHVLSKSYLDHIAKGEELLYEHMKTYGPTYNRHLGAFTEDLCDMIDQLFSQKVNSVLVGGGHSRFINSCNDGTKPIVVLNNITLSEDGVSPDIIQLLGVHKQAGGFPISTSTYPPYEKLIELLKE